MISIKAVYFVIKKCYRLFTASYSTKLLKKDLQINSINGHILGCIYYSSSLCIPVLDITISKALKCSSIGVNVT